MMAEVYLTRLVDKESYIRCFQNILNSYDCPQYHELLGDAYLHIKNVNSALFCFEKAMERKPRDERLINKMGNTLLAKGDNKLACQFFENHLRNEPNRISLRYALIMLYLKICSPKAADLLDDSVVFVEQLMSRNDRYLESGVKYLLSFSEFYEQLSNLNKYESTMYLVEKFQLKIVESCKNNRLDQRLEDSKKTMAEIYVKLAEIFERKNNTCNGSNVFGYFQQALEFDPSNSNAILGMAYFYEKQRNYAECKRYCSLIDCDESLFTTAKVLEYESNYGAALKIYEKLAMKNYQNTQWSSAYIYLLIRLGEMQKGEKFLDDRICSEKGSFSFLKGLICRCRGENMEAIKFFNQSRGDPLLRKDALLNMIQIYLSFDKLYLLVNNISKEESHNLQVARHLIKELEDNYENDISISIYQDYISLFQDSHSSQKIIHQLANKLNDQKVR